MALKFTSILSILIICCQFNRKIKLDESPEKTKEILLSHIPVGSDEMFAKKTMEENNFKCKHTNKGEFLDINNIDFIYCDREDWKGILVFRRWQIAIILKKNRLENIQVSTGLLGP